MQTILIICIVKILIGLAIISNFKRRDNQSLEQVVIPSPVMVGEKELPIKTILATDKFRWIFLMATCHFFFGYMWDNQFKIFGKNYINDDHFLTIVGATSQLFNGIGKIVIGAIADSIEFKRLYMIINAFECLIIMLIPLAVYSNAAFLAASCLIIAANGTMNTILPSFVLN